MSTSDSISATESVDSRDYPLPNRPPSTPADGIIFDIHSPTRAISPPTVPVPVHDHVAVARPEPVYDFPCFNSVVNNTNPSGLYRYWHQSASIHGHYFRTRPQDYPALVPFANIGDLVYTRGLSSTTPAYVRYEPGTVAASLGGGVYGNEVRDGEYTYGHLTGLRKHTHRQVLPFEILKIHDKEQPAPRVDIPIQPMTCGCDLRNLENITDIILYQQWLVFKDTRSTRHWVRLTMDADFSAVDRLLTSIPPSSDLFRTFRIISCTAPRSTKYSLIDRLKSMHEIDGFIYPISPTFGALTGATQFYQLATHIPNSSHVHNVPGLQYIPHHLLTRFSWAYYTYDASETQRVRAFFSYNKDHHRVGDITIHSKNGTGFLDEWSTSPARLFVKKAEVIVTTSLWKNPHLTLHHLATMAAWPQIDRITVRFCVSHSLPQDDIWAEDVSSECNFFLRSYEAVLAAVRAWLCCQPNTVQWRFTVCADLRTNVFSDQIDSLVGEIHSRIPSAVRIPYDPFNPTPNPFVQHGLPGTVTEPVGAKHQLRQRLILRTHNQDADGFLEPPAPPTGPRYRSGVSH